MSKYLGKDHPFRFQIEGGRILTFWAKVVPAKIPVTLSLGAGDVRASIEAKGVGNTQTCSMALCAKRQATAFPHRVEGFIDWTYSRAYVVSKINADGTPKECVVYKHNDDIAHLNDAIGGQRKLLANLKKNGAREIRLTPVSKRYAHPAGKANPKANKRQPPAIKLRGANLRFAVAQLGGAAL